ncbi:hypothetical protein T484DRAFT_1987336 [Baffinella frigidus]|nr:hypothetical protein T484DRAFT_1987336 [Cryptophyta sp. CCMP2293]
MARAVLPSSRDVPGSREVCRQGPECHGHGVPQGAPHLRPGLSPPQHPKALGGPTLIVCVGREVDPPSPMHLSRASAADLVSLAHVSTPVAYEAPRTPGTHAWSGGGRCSRPKTGFFTRNLKRCAALVPELHVIGTLPAGLSHRLGLEQASTLLSCTFPQSEKHGHPGAPRQVAVPDASILC